MALACTLQLSFFARDQAAAILNRFSGAAGGSSTHDLQFQSSLPGSASRTQACPEIGIRDLGSLDGPGTLERTRSSNAVRRLGGHGDQRYALQCPNDAIDLMDIRPLPQRRYRALLSFPKSHFRMRGWRSERGAPFARQRR